MTTFDGWDARYCGDSMALPPGMISEDYLMHFRTRGSKNGIRRYQQEDGSWTPLGLRLRKEREGWGETKKEQKAAKKEKKAQSQAEKMANRYEKRLRELTGQMPEIRPDRKGKTGLKNAISSVLLKT